MAGYEWDELMLLAQKTLVKGIVNIRKPWIALNARAMGRKQKISHVTCYSAGNAGDTALSECVRRTFNSIYAHVSWNLISVHRPVKTGTVNKINKTNLLVIGGGGLFLPDTNANPISGWQWACGKEQLEQIKVPIIIYSVGYNYFRGQEPDELFIANLNALTERSVFFGIRNNGSIEAIRALLRPELKNKLCYQPCTTTVIRYLLPQLPPKEKTGKVAFNFAFDREERRFGESRDEILKQLVQSMYAIRDKGYEIYIVAHCPADLMVMQYIKNHSHIHVVNASCWELKRLVLFYNEIDVVLGMRGHAQMIPFGVNCQIISLGTHEKMKWFLKDIDAMDWYIDLNEEIENIAGRIVRTFEIVHEKECARTDKRLHEAQDMLWRITCENMQQIRQSTCDYRLTEISGGVIRRQISIYDVSPMCKIAYFSPQRGGREYAA